MPTPASPALTSLCWHLDVAVEWCEAGGDGWTIVAEAAAFVAEGAARRLEGVEADRLLVVAGTCRGAAASPSREALEMLRGMADEVRGGTA